MPPKNSFRPADMILRELQAKLPGSKLSTSSGFPILFFRKHRIMWRQRNSARGLFMVYTGHRDTRDVQEMPFQSETGLVLHFAAATKAQPSPPSAPLCPYCGSSSKLVDRSVLYGPGQVGKIYLCSSYPQCDACIGADPDTYEAYGTMANAHLRKLRGAAHSAFDPLWKGRGGRLRTAAYQAAAKVLGVENFHIGNSTPDQCNCLLKQIDVVRHQMEEGIGRTKSGREQAPVLTGHTLSLF